MKLIIAGHRDFHDWKVICHGMKLWQEYYRDTVPTEIISGGANGVDALGELWARNHSIPTKIFPADWKIHNKAAGPIRNQQMAEYADGAIIFLRSNQKSSGSMDMLKRAMSRNLHVHVYDLLIGKINQIHDPRSMKLIKSQGELF